MSKTIIITTDEMEKIIRENFNNSEVIDNVYCKNCFENNENKCECKNDKCPYQDTDKPYKYFVEKMFSNYMIPFS